MNATRILLKLAPERNAKEIDAIISIDRSCVHSCYHLSLEGRQNMIARVWSARASFLNLEAYKSHLSRNVFPELSSIPGFVRAELFTRANAGESEIVVTTVWKDLASIEAFAHPDRETAVVAPEAAALLTYFDRRVRHYEISLTT
jgi:heme-degrading monooxygenase HmoA